MSTLSDLYTASATKVFLAQNNAGLVCLVQQKLDNNWFLAIPAVAISEGYASGGSFILLSGTEAIWSAL